MAALLDNQRWSVERTRYYGRFKLKPIREYGPQPENGDELVPASALDKATEAMQAALGARTRAEANGLLRDALKDLRA